MSTLSGLKVLDLTRVLAGPLATMMLGDLGADVIKVERPGSGDESRGWGPPFHPNGMSSYFLSTNRNKKSIALDLGSEPDRDLLAELLRDADVVVDNFLPGALQRRGIVPERILEQQQSLVWCTLSGFGPTSARPGYDFVIQAERGWMSITGEPAGMPMKVGVALADVIAGKDAAIAILAAVAAIGRGSLLSAADRRISIALAHSATAALINVAQNALITGEEPRRHGNAHPNLVPYQLFETADGAIVLAVGNDDQWRSCLSAMRGLDDLAVSEFSTNAGRVRGRERVTTRLAARFLEEVTAHWMRVLSEASVPCGEVRGVLEALRSVNASALTGVAPSVPGQVRFPPPFLDQHGSELRARGWAAFQAANG